MNRIDAPKRDLPDNWHNFANLSVAAAIGVATVEAHALLARGLTKVRLIALEFR
jgi:hypothetical protein